MGLQHALAMVGGLITPPLLVSALAFGVRPGTTIPYSSGNPADTQRCECGARAPWGVAAVGWAVGQGMVGALPRVQSSLAVK